MKLVRSRHPTLRWKQIEQIAEKEYNRAAKTFLMKTLKKAREVRPNALWGLYDFPFCNGKAGEEKGDFECSKEAQNYNDRMAFIYNTSRAFYPSIYLNGKKTFEQNFRFNRAIINEARRIANDQQRRVDYYVYTKFEYDPYTRFDWFYKSEDICNTMKLPADLGASGLVLWSTSKNMRDRCGNIDRYMRNQLLPYISTMRDQIGECRREMCSGNGNCVLKKQLKKCYQKMNYADYECRCDRGFDGPDCSLKKKSTTTIK
ncbi:EGF-like domain protein [Necator americanus]|uniref:Hyaluronidase n=1 Tax=Necator americanus TaxID=51031 RepID=W2SPF9_NECAM|nr:EGF-like domain protein [Necator americanus]ETN71535.1 EGF-like domain protein [Necator americanus]